MPTNKITEIFSGWSGKSKRKKTPTMVGERQ